jgi:hypothetical protein
MRAIITAVGLAATVACGGPVTTPKPADTAETGTPGTTPPTDTDTDTEPTGTDADGDGWTVEDGDCDDSSVWVNPSWPEDTHDDIDNDCDGLVDEAFTGVTVVEYDWDAGAAWLHDVDPLGNLDRTVPLSPAVAPSWALWMKPSLIPGVWVANDSLGVHLIDDTTGVVTELLDLEEIEWPKGIGDFGAFGVETHPGGYYLISTINALVQVNPDGTWDVVAQWVVDLHGDPSHEVAPVDLAIDPKTHEVGLFGIGGGYATWSENDGFVLHKRDDLFYGSPYAWVAGSSNEGGHFALATDVYTGENGVFAWQDGDVTALLAWPNADFTPVSFGMESESGDAYAVANGGWYRTVWRLYADGSGGAQLFTTGKDNDSAGFFGVAVNVEEGG